MSEIQILLVDDHALLRDGLRRIIDGEPGMRVVAEAGSMREAIDVAKHTVCDLLLIDIALPDGLGTDLVKRLRGMGHDAPAVALSMHESPSFLQSALDAGCAAYVAKRAASSELIRVVRAVAAGERPLRPDARESGFPESERPLSTIPPVTGAIPTLSNREEQVLALVAGGSTNQEAADCLGVSVKTVEGYRLRVTRKLGVRTRAQLVRLAMAAGLVHD